MRADKWQIIAHKRLVLSDPPGQGPARETHAGADAPLMGYGIIILRSGAAFSNVRTR
jgi:hypothetical protein